MNASWPDDDLHRLVSRVAGDVGLNLDLLEPDTDLTNTGKLGELAHHASLELGLEPPAHLVDLRTPRDIVAYLTGATMLKAAKAANALAPRIDGIAVQPPTWWQAYAGPVFLAGALCGAALLEVLHHVFR